MWIRSQDKETLTNVKHLSIRYLNGYYAIYTDNHLAPNEICNLAMYKTKEKALQVLDLVEDYKMYQYMKTSNYKGKPFQMPQDKRV